MIVGIGETILDIIFKNDQPVAAVPGGSTFNALISLGRVLRPSKSPLKGDLEGDSCPPHLTQIGSRNCNLSLCHIDAGKDCEESKY